MKLVMVGFRHGHAGAIYQTAQKLDFVDIVACVEEDPAAREGIPAQLGVELTHESFQQVLDEVEFDALLPGHGPVAMQDGMSHVQSAHEACSKLFLPTNLV